MFKMYLRRLLSVTLITVICSMAALAADGDTVTIRTIEFGQKTGKFKFPEKSEQFSKVMINYKIKCPCAEWDYMAYVFANDIELFRYITPYGNGLSVGDGFSHQLDVTDFSTFLRDSVTIRSENSQEDVEITFDFIKGTPPRNIIAFEPLFRIEKEYNPQFEEFMPPLNRTFSENEKFVRLKIIQSGHGWDNSDRCNEFCKKDGFVKVNGVEKYRTTIWRDDCRLNPIYPQGGTWLISRSNWCPGSEVNYYDYELGDFIKSGEENEIDYDMEYYQRPDTVGDARIWRIAAFLITYSEPNFQNDAQIYDILYPSKKDMFKRMNPVCSEAAVVIRNTGAQNLTSAKLKLRINGGNEFEYQWSGNLKFYAMDTVLIPLSGNITYNSNENLFEVEIIEANGKADDYAANNKGITRFDVTPEYYKQISIVLKTNNYAAEQYVLTLKDASGQELLRKENLTDNTIFEYPFDLADGCYELRLINKLGYGLDNIFMRSQLGTGYLALNARGKLYKTFGGDFGGEILHQFRVAEKPEISVSTDSLWFGEVNISENAYKSIEVEPVGNKPLLISEAKIILSDMRKFYLESTEPEIPKEGLTLQTGQKLKINIRYSPVKAGSVTSALNIKSNDELRTIYSVKLTALAIDPAGIDLVSSDLPELSIVPNVSRDIVKFYYSSINSTAKFKIEITDAFGRTVDLINDAAQLNEHGEMDYDCSKLTQGMYFVTLTTTAGSVTEKLIVVK